MKNIEIKLKDNHSLSRQILPNYKPKKFSYPKLSWHVYSDSHGNLDTSTYLEISTKYGEKEQITLVLQDISHAFEHEVREYKSLAKEFVDDWNSEPKAHWNQLLEELLEYKRVWAKRSRDKADEELSFVDKKLSKLRNLVTGG